MASSFSISISAFPPVNRWVRAVLCLGFMVSGITAEDKLPLADPLPTEPALPLVEPTKMETPVVAPQPAAQAPYNAVVEAQAKALESGVSSEKISDLLAVIADLEVRQSVMAKELQKSKTDAGNLKDENDRLKLQMQALGVAALTGDERSLQLRVINAVSDYRIADQKRAAVTEQLVKICDAVTALQHSTDVSSRRRLDEALADSTAVLKGSAPAEELSPTPVEQARVVSYKRELGLAAINCGKASELRLGMPLSFVRKDRTIAQGVITDCRERLCGVLITSTPGTADGVAIGDAIKLETTQKQK